MRDMSGASDKPECSWSERLHLNGVQALYVHIPFCAHKCVYCDFASWATASSDPLMARYEAAIESQIQEAYALGLLEDCQSAYVGGGTPTLLGAELGWLVSCIRAKAPIAEFSCEANPDSLTDDVLLTLKEAGATRISLGVQSFRDAELLWLGRIHSAKQAFDRVRAAASMGFDVSCDVMCALKGQTQKSWQQTLATFLELDVDHVSVYPLSIEEGTPLAKQTAGAKTPWNGPDVQAGRMEEAEKILKAAGYARYEVASYARNHKVCRHNLSYWTAQPYIGLGTGAASMLTREGYDTLKSVHTSLPQPPKDAFRARLKVRDTRQSIADGKTLADASFDVEFLDVREAAAEDLMLGARLTQGLSPSLVAYAQEVLGKERVEGTLESCVHDGLLARTAAGALAPTESGWLLGNELYGRLWDLH